MENMTTGKLATSGPHPEKIDPALQESIDQLRAHYADTHDLRCKVKDALRSAIDRRIRTALTAKDIMAIVKLCSAYHATEHPGWDVEEKLLKVAADFGERATTNEDFNALAELTYLALNWR